jgi:hypothetical protein
MKCFYDTTLVLLVIGFEIRVMTRITINIYNLSINIPSRNLNKPRRKKRASIYYNLKLLKPRMTK